MLELAAQCRSVAASVSRVDRKAQLLTMAAELEAAAKWAVVAVANAIRPPMR
jgi:hypothetical protein